MVLSGALSGLTATYFGPQISRQKSNFHPAGLCW